MVEELNHLVSADLHASKVFRGPATVGPNAAAQNTTIIAADALTGAALGLGRSRPQHDQRKARFRRRRRACDEAAAAAVLIGGVLAASANPVTGSLVIHYDRARLSPARLWAAAAPQRRRHQHDQDLAEVGGEEIEDRLSDMRAQG